MVVYPDLNNAVLSQVPTALQPRKTVELIEGFAANGLTVTLVNDEIVRLNLRGLALMNGSLEHGQQALYEALALLRATCVDVESSDVPYLLDNNEFTLAISRRLVNRDPQIQRLLTSVEPDELFSNLDAAVGLVTNDVNESADLSYRDCLEWSEPAPPPLPREFEADVAPWRSPFDTDWNS